MNDWFEIFRTGTHTDNAGTTTTWTEADLDEIVSKYNTDNYEAPIVIGHPATDAPAYGWIEKLERAGDILLAKAKQLVPEFVDLVRKGMYKKVSIAITPDYELRHVGFLGAAAPAVSGLIPAQFAAGDKEVILFESGAAEKVFEEKSEEEKSKVQSAKSEGEHAEPEKVEETPVQQFAAGDPALKLENEVLRAQIEKSDLQKHKAEFENYLGEKIRWGNLTTAQADACRKLLEMIIGFQFKAAEGKEYVYEFAAGDKAAPVDVLKGLIDLMPKQIVYAEVATKVKREGKEEFSDTAYAAKLINISMKNKS